ncbi:MAG: hypothetical protein D3924_19330, partial [Candidatus Electrothrix sp. AR4]|nr:hypothetical protein [Candidatus Electrothrix sp. AR4]
CLGLGGGEFDLIRQIQEHPDFSQLPVIVLGDVSVFTALENNVQDEQQAKPFTASVLKPFSTFDLLLVIADTLSITLNYEEDHSKCFSEASVEDELSGKCEREEKNACPPNEDLEELFVKARQGDIAGVNQKTSLLLSKDAGRYKEFALEVERLAENFQLDMIVNLIKKIQNSQ